MPSHFIRHRWAFVLGLAALSISTPRLDAFDSKDIEDAVAVLNRVAGEIGMDDDEREMYENALEGYGAERERVMEQMIALLSRWDPSGIHGAWKDHASKGLELLSKLDSGPQKLAEIGLEDFAKGEKKIFELLQQAIVPSMVNVMVKLEAQDVELIKKYQEDISKVRDGDKAIQASLEASESEFRTELKDAAKAMAALTIKATRKAWLGNPPWKDQMDFIGETGMQSLESHLKGAKEKRLLKQILLDDIRYVEEARDKLSVEWIEEVFKTGVSAASEIPGAGRNDEYKAADWERFKSEAISCLGSVRNRTMEGSKKLLDEILPAFKEEVKAKFSCVLNDRSKFESWCASVDEEFQSIDDVFDRANGLANEIAEGPFKKALIASIHDARNQMIAFVKIFFDTKTQVDDVMKGE